MHYTDSSITVVFVPGAWHGADCWDLLKDCLSPHSNFNFVAVTLPSVGCLPSSDSTKSWKPDVDAISDAVSKAIVRSELVVLVSHSYGSIVASEALKCLSIADRTKLRHIVLCGFLLDAGQYQRSPDSNAAYSDVWDVRGNLVFINQPAKYFYGGLEQSEQERWAAAAKRTHMPIVSFTSTVTYAAWKDVATLYVLSEADNVIPIARQRSMVAEAQKKGAPVTTATLPSGHFPMLTMPDRVATIVTDLIHDQRLATRAS